VWQHEPAVNETLLEMSIVGTPHIAGYSNRSKRQATELAVAHMMMSLESGKTSMPDDVVRPKLYTDVTPKSSIDEILDIGGELLPSRLVDDYLDHDRSLRASIKLPTSEERLREFRHLRTKLPYRDEYRDTSRQIFPSSAWPLLDLFRDF
jgi:hypothetical protein